MANPRIGITERGDAAIDFQWVERCLKAKAGQLNFDGAVIITKNVSERFRKELMKVHRAGFPLILHATCTGMGHTVMEPNVPACELQLGQVMQLIKDGFPASRVVLRIDPVIPQYAKCADNVLSLAKSMGLLGQNKGQVRRVRMSVYDEYPHVRGRLAKMGMPPFYPDGSFYAPKGHMDVVRALLGKHPDVAFEACAEKYLDAPNLVHMGCVSDTDLRLMGLPEYDGGLNPQNRTGCMCIRGKSELLSSAERKPCPHGCAYCFWKRDGE